MPSWPAPVDHLPSQHPFLGGLNSHYRGLPVFKILTLRCYLRLPGFQRPTMGITAPPSEHIPLRRRCFWGQKETTLARRGAVPALALFPRSDESQFLRSKLLLNGELSFQNGIRLCHRLTRLRPVLFKGHRPIPDVSPDVLHDAVFNIPVFHCYRRANLEACSPKNTTRPKANARMGRAPSGCGCVPPPAGFTGTKWNGPRFFGLRDKKDRSTMEGQFDALGLNPE
jgi:hypothetical protein